MAGTTHIVTTIIHGTTHIQTTLHQLLSTETVATRATADAKEHAVFGAVCMLVNTLHVQFVSELQLLDFLGTRISINFFLVGNPCNAYNCARGNYLHPYPFDSNRYIQCDITPGRQFIRFCPAGLVFDPRFSVCNYPTGVVQYYNHYASQVLYGK